MTPTLRNQRFWPLFPIPKNVWPYPLKMCPANSQAFTTEGELGLRVLTKPSTLVHHSQNVCFCDELIFDALSRPHCNSQGCVTAGCCGDCGQGVNFSDSPFWISVVQVWIVVGDFCVVSISFCISLALAGFQKSDDQRWVAKDVPRNVQSLHALARYVRAPKSIPGPTIWKYSSCWILLWYSSRSLSTSSSLCAPNHGMLPVPPRKSEPQLPPCLRPGCTLEAHQHLLAPHLDLLALFYSSLFHERERSVLPGCYCCVFGEKAAEFLTAFHSIIPN